MASGRRAWKLLNVGQAVWSGYAKEQATQSQLTGLSRWSFRMFQDHNENMRPADTSPEAWEVLTTLERNMPPAEKMQLAFEWSEIIRQFAEAGLRERYPQASEREIFLRYARQTLGEQLFHTVYGNELPNDAPSCQNA